MSKKGRHTSAIHNELLLASLSRFFSKPSHMKSLLCIINGTTNISLRLIDWFVTNYCKKWNVVINRAKGEYINVYIHYRSQLRAFSKQLFDPFRRQDKIVFYYDKQNYIHTTIGQLNFFRWAIENEVLDYIHKNSDAILADMNSTQKTITPPPVVNETPKKTNKRNEVKSSLNNMSLMKGSCVLKFD